MNPGRPNSGPHLVSGPAGTSSQRTVQRQGGPEPSSPSLLPGEDVKGHFITLCRTPTKRSRCLSNPREVWPFPGMKFGRASAQPPLPATLLLFPFCHGIPLMGPVTVSVPMSAAHHLPRPPLEQEPHQGRDPAWPGQGLEKCPVRSRASTDSITLLFTKA